MVLIGVMEKYQSDKLRRAADNDEDINNLFRYYAEHKASYTELSMRGIVQGTKAHGLRIGQPKAREFISLLVDAGIGKGVKDESGHVTHITKMSSTTKEIGAAVVGDNKDVKKFAAKVKERNMGGVAEAVREAPSALKVFPYRASSNLSITLTINGKPVTLPLPDLEPEELAAIIKRLKATEDKRG